MSWVFISVILLTIIQAILTHGLRWFMLAFLLVIISRVLFLGRLVGATVKVKSLFVLEGFSVGIVLLVNILSKSTTEWGQLLGYIFLSAVSCLIMLADDVFFLYITEDVKDGEDED